MDTTGRHPSTAQAVRGLAYDHLPAHLQEVSKPFHDLGQQLLDRLPDDPELSAALRKLREAKDCAVLLAAISESDEGSR
ncbi:hypothetical protein B1H20_17050 [Streptomyces violaceoruber]|uniref:Uncharacterized protein n=1 Tax=Streptomyces violaceoruber TaxID=1935 RepID=A0A1V0UCE4_STRVN|nr:MULTISPECIES: hypothetical protein [Streptomyces]ARF62905.1 hypothetical protein B1H20_17050 [Streptomyces violaceoruber]NEC45770.1 hypothetical protein [Streptomyces sp. SID8016]